jgi:hypothetical protein
MSPFVVDTLAVLGIYAIWRGYQLAQQHRERVMRERVVMLLWAAAQHAR